LGRQASSERVVVMPRPQLTKAECRDFGWRRRRRDPESHVMENIQLQGVLTG